MYQNTEHWKKMDNIFRNSPSPEIRAIGGNGYEAKQCSQPNTKTKLSSQQGTYFPTMLPTTTTTSNATGTAIPKSTKYESNTSNPKPNKHAHDELFTNACKSNPTISSTDHTINYFSYLNIQGLCPQTVQSKVNYVSDLLKCNKQLFIGLSETWLNESHTDAETFIEGYTLFKGEGNKKFIFLGNFLSILRNHNLTKKPSNNLLFFT